MMIKVETVFTNGKSFVVETSEQMINRDALQAYCNRHHKHVDRVMILNADGLARHTFRPEYMLREAFDEAMKCRRAVYALVSRTSARTTVSREYPGGTFGNAMFKVFPSGATEYLNWA